MTFMKTTRKFLPLALLCCAFLSPGAVAHGDWPPKHGGIMNIGGETTFELVQGKRGVTVYVEDHGQPLATQGSQASFTIARPAGTSTFVAQAAGGNKLHVPGAVVREGDKVTLKVTLGNGSVAVGRFSVGKAGR
jgi:hypothetical protein